MERYDPIPLVAPLRQSDIVAAAKAVYEEMDTRRSVRTFSDEAVPREAVVYAIRAASTAQSGAHRQPWTFVLVRDAETKRDIRVAAESEERKNYQGGRLPPEWRQALEPLGTDWTKPFLETAPWLVVVFEQRYGVTEDGDRFHNYYVKESVGIACGLSGGTVVSQPWRPSRGPSGSSRAPRCRHNSKGSSARWSTAPSSVAVLSPPSRSLEVCRPA